MSSTMSSTTEPAYAKLPALGVPFAPLLCCQTSASRAHRLVCAHCLRPAAGMSEELCLSLGLRSRRALRAGGRAALPSAACLPDNKDVAAGGVVTRWCNVAATCSGGGVGGGGDSEAAAGGEGGGACLEAYCSDACREAARDGHALLCEGGLAEGAPLRAFGRLARQHEDASLSLAASLLSQALAEVQRLARQVPPLPLAELAAAAAARAAELATTIGEAVEDVDEAEDDMDAEEAMVVEGEAAAEVAASEGRRRQLTFHRAAAAERAERAEALGEAWHMLRIGLFERLGDAGQASAPNLLSRALFMQLVNAIRRRLVPIETPSPLVAYCSVLGVPSTAPSASAPSTAPSASAPSTAPSAGAPITTPLAGALRTAPLTGAPSTAPSAASTARAPAEAEARAVAAMRALCWALCERERRAGRRPERAAYGPAGGTAAEQLHACLLAEAAAEAAAEVAAASTADAAAEVAAASTADAAADSSTDAKAVAQRRRLCLLAQCAPHLFPPASLVVFDPRLGSLAHSCLPTAQLQPAATSASDSSELRVHASAHYGAPWLRVALVPLRQSSIYGAVDSAAREPPTLAWVNVSSADVEARAALLQSRLGRRYRCACVRCECERSGGRGVATCTRLAIARDAIEDGRFEEVVALLHGLYGSHAAATTHAPAGAGRAGACPTLSSSAAEGDGWMMLGMALLNLGRWHEAHAAWHAGALLAPSHALLAKQARKDAAYAVAAEAGNVADVPLAAGDEAPSGGMAGALCEVVVLPCRSRIVSTRSPLFGAPECADAIAMAEAHAAVTGGWTTSRHHAVPTTDVPVHEVPALLSWFRRALRDRLRPLLARHFGVAGDAVGVHDAFLVKYTAGAQAHLPLHMDESRLSVTLVLNDGFCGGGTYFAGLRRSLCPGVGHVIAFDGAALHGGEPIVHGTRYIIAAFLFVDEPPQMPLRDAQSSATMGGLLAKRARADKPRAEANGDSIVASESKRRAAAAGTAAVESFAFNFG